jgi:hypothetical protein
MIERYPSRQMSPRISRGPEIEPVATRRTVR